MKAVLVPYEDGDRSSIFFYTTKNIRYRGINRIDRELRSFPTFEQISDGKHVINLIQEKLNEQDRPSLIKANSTDLENERKGKYLNTNQIIWNKIIGGVYLLYVMLFLTLVTDQYILTPRYFEDEVISSIRGLNQDGNEIYTKYHTALDKTFSTSTMQGSKDSKIELGESPIFHCITYISMNGRDRTHTLTSGMRGVSLWIYSIFSIYIGIACIMIFLHDGRIPKDEQEFLYFGPIAAMFVSYIVWVIWN